MKKQIILLATILALASCKKTVNNTYGVDKPTKSTNGIALTDIKGHSFILVGKSGGSPIGNSQVLSDGVWTVQADNGNQFTFTPVDPAQFYIHQKGEKLTNELMVDVVNYYQNNKQ
jgi:hypothetical protein